MKETFFHPFVIPFIIGVVSLFVTIIYKYANWFIKLSKEDKKTIKKGVFSKATPLAIGEIIKESLLHLKIFKISPKLGYMHMSLAFGWFLLIIVGMFETFTYAKDAPNLPHIHVFFKYFFSEASHAVSVINFAFIMDLLLLFVLSGVAMAIFKRFSSKSLGVKRATKHTPFDKVALSSLWLIFPARLLAESVTSGIYHNGSFLTNTIGESIGGVTALQPLEVPAWTLYSVVLGVFFVAMPFSRYMHIFTEIPHIFLKRYKVEVKERESAVDNFQIQACSRCGICIDPCQMQSSACVNDMQAVYFLRDRRYGSLKESVATNCLMCGKCENVCPVGIDLNALRQNTRVRLFEEIVKANPNRFDYINVAQSNNKGSKIGYFSGCMTQLTPNVILSMEKIFKSVGEDVWFADKNGGVCCGRPMSLAGDIEGAKKMFEFNEKMFKKEGITTLVTSCPICLKGFKKDYALKGVEVLHHTQYIAQMIDENRLKLTSNDEDVVYHDPCELGRGLGIYEEPRKVISAVSKLKTTEDERDKGDCCGGSLANIYVKSDKRYKIANDLTLKFEKSGAKKLITSCPMCKKSLKKGSNIEVMDVSELIAVSIASI